MFFYKTSNCTWITARVPKRFEYPRVPGKITSPNTVFRGCTKGSLNRHTIQYTTHSVYLFSFDCPALSSDMRETVSIYERQW